MKLCVLARILQTAQLSNRGLGLVWGYMMTASILPGGAYSDKSTRIYNPNFHLENT